MLQGLTLLPMAWTWLAPFWRTLEPVCLLLLLVQLMAPSHGPVDQVRDPTFATTGSFPWR